MDILVGRRLGPYQLEGLLGAGGMGVVYRAIHRGLDVPRAVKILPMNLAADPIFVARFEREARLAVRLRHANIVPVHDIGEADGIHYLAMELLEGHSLREVMAAERPMPLPRALDLLRQLAAALDYAHANSVAHRDVKPANAFISPSGHLTLVDFGIARAAEESKLTSTGMIIGTAEYMAPEQAEGRGSGASADLYALGIVAYEMLAGRVPFVGPNTLTILRQQLEATPPPPRSFRAEIPEMMEQIVLRQLSKNPAERFATGRAFVAALTATATPQLPASRESVFDSRQPTVPLSASQLADIPSAPGPQAQPLSAQPRPSATPEIAPPEQSPVPATPTTQAPITPPPSSATPPTGTPRRDKRGSASAQRQERAAARRTGSGPPVLRVWLVVVLISPFFTFLIAMTDKRYVLAPVYCVLVLLAMWVARVRRSFSAGIVAVAFGGLAQTVFWSLPPLVLPLLVYGSFTLGFPELIWHVVRMSLIFIGCPTMLAAIGIVLGDRARYVKRDSALAWVIVLVAVGLLVTLTAPFAAQLF